MHSALDGQGTMFLVGRLQEMSEANQTIAPLFCDYPGCGKPVRFVPAHNKNRKGRPEPIEVGAYIGLSSGSAHVTGCRYDAPGKLKQIIAAQADHDFLAELEAGKHELRLLALFNELAPASAAANAKALGANANDPAQRPTGYARSAEKLASYLRTTKDLLLLRAACEDDEFLAANLVLRLGKKRIRWNDFFFEQARYDEVWEMLTASGCGYPIALVGTVKSHGVSGSTTFLNCASKFVPEPTSEMLQFYEASVAHKDGAWLREFSVGTEVVIFGVWKVAKTKETLRPDAKDPTKQKTYRNHQITLNPKFKPQVIAVE